MNDCYFDPAPTDPAQSDPAPGFIPRPSARGPWAEDMLHGRLLGGIGAMVLEDEFCGDGWRAARLTVDLFRPAGMTAVTVQTTTIRTGRKLKVCDATLLSDGHEVGRVTAVFLIQSEEPPGTVWAPTPSNWPNPETMEPAPDEDAWQVRTVEGGFATGVRSRLWTNDTRNLVADRPMTPLVRAAVSGDLACPIANSGDQGLFFINADYTMLIGRYPVGGWIGLEVDQRISADGISVASATLVDRDGPFATSGGTSLARASLESQ